MIKKTLLALALLCHTLTFAQKNGDYTAVAAAIKTEAYKLFYLERASWLGTDIMLESFDKKELGSIGGYFSYKEAENKYTCLFFNKDESPKVIFSTTFDTTFSDKTVEIKYDVREFTTAEKDVYEVRKKTAELLQNDKIFEFYKNTNPNIIPLVEGNSRKAYVLTGTTENGVVIFGNDYLVEYDAKLNVTNKKKLHQNLISITTKSEGEGTAVASVHNHVAASGDYITATDLCTLLLYGPLVAWEEHIVLSPKAVSIWNYKTKTLAIISRKAFDKVLKHQNKLGK